MNTMTQMSVLLFSGILLTGATGDESSQRYEEDECVVWRNISNYIMSQDSMTVSCSRNQQCTGTDCAGSYSLLNDLVGRALDVRLCFGIYIHPCSDEDELSVYTEFRSPTQASFRKVFTHNDTVEIPDTKMSIAGMGETMGILDVTMVPKTINGKKYMLAGVQFRIRIRIASREMWPDHYRTTLVPDVYIPVPRCHSSVVTPKHKAGSCHSSEIPTTRAPTKKPPVPQPLPGSVCTVNEMGECRNNEICVPVKETKGRCVCATGMLLDKEKDACVPEDAPSESIPVYEYPGEDPVPSSNKNVIIIATCSVLGVLIIAAILLFVVFKYRAHQARYGGHQPLSTDTHDDNDDPLII